MKQNECVVVLLDKQEVYANVEFEYHKGCKGAREGGLQLEPDEPSECEITSVKLCGMEIISIVDTDALNIDLCEYVENRD